MPDITISRLAPAQLEDAIQLVLRAFEPSYEDSARFEFGWSLSGDPSYYRPHSFIASVNGRLAGVSQCAANYAHPDTFSLGWIAVDPETQGAGIGHAIVTHIEDYIARKLLKGKTGTILIIDNIRKTKPKSDFYFKHGYVDGPLTHQGMHVMVKIVNPA